MKKIVAYIILDRHERIKLLKSPTVGPGESAIKLVISIPDSLPIPTVEIELPPRPTPSAVVQQKAEFGLAYVLGMGWLRQAAISDGGKVLFALTDDGIRDIAKASEGDAWKALKEWEIRRGLSGLDIQVWDGERGIDARLEQMRTEKEAK